MLFRVVGILQEWASDMRFALRLFKRGPAYFVTLIGIIVVGVGATTAMFSIVESLLLRPLSYPHPEQLSALRIKDSRTSSSPVSLPDFLDWQSQATTFERLSASMYQSLGLATNGAKPERLDGANVSGEFFSVLGLPPLRGRLLSAQDDRVGGPRVAVVSASLWHRRFESNPKLIGQTISLNGIAYTVVGVAAEGFRFARLNLDRVDVWTPLAVTLPGYAALTSLDRGNHFLHVIGRRKAGVSLEQAQDQLSAIAKRLEAAYPESNAKSGVWVADLRDFLVESSRSTVLVLFVSVAFFFAVVCSNVANLLLTKAQSRRAEMAVRAALGATPSRLVVQLLTETVLVFFLGAIGGAVLAEFLVGLLASAFVNRGVASAIDVKVDTNALLFAVATSFVCGVLFGLGPAMVASRVQAGAVLKETATQAGQSKAQQSLRAGFVVAQFAITFTLLVGSGLALRALARSASIPPGFEPTNLATAKVTLAEARYESKDSVLAFYRSVLERIAVSPGVASVASTSTLPLGPTYRYAFEIEGRAPFAANEGPGLGFHTVTPGYFATVGIPLLRGRDFTVADIQDGRPVMVISQATALRFFPGVDALGQRVDWGFNDGEWKHIWREIVGVVGDVRSEGLSQPIDIDGYIPLTQNPSAREMSFVVRSRNAESTLRTLPEVVQALDGDQDVANLALMTDLVAGSIKNQRYMTVVLGAFAVAGLLLATAGMFGLISYTTTLRTRELGIRMALGSTPGAVVRLVLISGSRLLLSGMAIGTFSGIFVGRAMSSRIPNLDAFDAVVLLAVAGILGVAGLLACLGPAWRAAMTPPAQALRYT